MTHHPRPVLAPGTLPGASPLTGRVSESGLPLRNLVWPEAQGAPQGEPSQAAQVGPRERRECRCM